MSIKNTFAPQPILQHPFKSLLEAGRGWLNQTNGWIGQKIFQPLYCLIQGERWCKSAVVSDNVKKFRSYQRREDELFTALSFRLNRHNRFGIGRVVSNRQLDKDITIQAYHRLANISSASSC